MRFTKVIDAMRGGNTGEFTSMDSPGTFRARGGDDTVTGTDGNDRIYGGAGNDILLGDPAFDAGNDRMYGGNGRDLLIGRGGKDRLWAGKGRDELAGEDGDDFLYGGAGNDFISDGAGKDNYWGGGGRDVFHLSDISGRGNRIKDFQNGKDTVFLDFEGVDFSDVNLSKKKAGVMVTVDGTNDRVLIEDARLNQINRNDFGFNDEMG